MRVIILTPFCCRIGFSTIIQILSVLGPKVVVMKFTSPFALATKFLDKLLQIGFDMDRGKYGLTTFIIRSPFPRSMPQRPLN